MSLLHRLLISVTVVVLCILVGTLSLSIGSARDYLNGQLRSQGENAASSLALLLSQPANDDEASRELLMAALFDTGQFRAVRFIGVNNEILFDRMQPGRYADRAPDWFNGMLPLERPIAERDVNDGWRQLGTLVIQVDDAYARDALWSSSVRLFVFVSIAGLFWALFAVFLVRWLKKALAREVGAQLQALTQRNSETENTGPVMDELKGVSSLISTVRERVMATETELESRIESLTLELNQDPVTGLANRKFFINELRRALQGTEESSAHGQGHVLIMRLRDLVALSKAIAHAELDDWLRQIARHVQGVTEAMPDPKPYVARLNGSDFAVLMPELDGPEATRHAERLRQLLVSTLPPGAAGTACRWAFALVDYVAGNQIGPTLARLDYALMRAESAGHGSIEYSALADANPDALHGGSEWRALITEAVESGRFFIQVQASRYGWHSAQTDVVSPSRPLRIFHEARLMMHDGNENSEPLSAFLFMPPAVRLGLSGACDVQAVRCALDWLAQNAGDLIVRFSLPSLLPAQFRADVSGLLADAPEEIRGRLWFELDAHGLVSQGAEVREFCSTIRQLGVHIGLRRLGQQPEALMFLHLAAVDYVKLGGDFITGLTRSPGSQHVLSAVMQTTRDLSIQVFADDIPDSTTGRMLNDQGVLTRLE
ncbi:MAG: EAL domain-containing protein [Alcaligenaceae bacterium]|nr:EAL domain-containing protein [Alcaligenaceae bacterium]